MDIYRCNQIDIHSQNSSAMKLLKGGGQVTTAWLYLGIGLTTLLSPINTLPFKCWEVPGGIKAKYIYNSSVNHNIFGLKRSYKVMFLAAWNTALSFCKSKQTFHELKTRFAKEKIFHEMFIELPQNDQRFAQRHCCPHIPPYYVHIIMHKILGWEKQRASSERRLWVRSCEELDTNTKQLDPN